MNNNLKPGQFYDIIYLDTNYPCKCICHINLDVKHVVACCQDKSFQFLNAEYVGWGDKNTECFKIGEGYIYISIRKYPTTNFIKVSKLNV